MRRLFLSGQMTCAMLLGAGLLLRAQAALHSGTDGSGASVTRPSELLRPAPKMVRVETTPAPRTVHKISHSRKGFAHRNARHGVRKHGVALAGRYQRG